MLPAMACDSESKGHRAGVTVTVTVKVTVAQPVGSGPQHERAAGPGVLSPGSLMLYSLAILFSIYYLRLLSSRPLGHRPQTRIAVAADPGGLSQRSICFQVQVVSGPAVL